MPALADFGSTLSHWILAHKYWTLSEKIAALVQIEKANEAI